MPKKNTKKNLVHSIRQSIRRRANTGKIKKKSI